MKNKKTIALAMAAATVAPMTMPVFADTAKNIPLHHHGHENEKAGVVNVRTAKGRELNELVHEDNLKEYLRANSGRNPKKVGKVFDENGTAYYAIELDMDLTTTINKDRKRIAAVKLEELKKELNTLKAQKYDGKDRYKFEVVETQVEYVKDKTIEGNPYIAKEGKTVVYVTDNKIGNAPIKEYTFIGSYKFDENDFVDVSEIEIELGDGETAYQELSKCILKLQKAKDKIYTTTSLNADKSVMTVNIYRTDKKVLVGQMFINSYNEFNKKILDKWTISINSDFIGHWAEDDIIDAMFKGQVALTANFRARENITRAEFASMVCKIYGQKAKPAHIDSNKKVSFTDVEKEDWFYNDVMVLAQLGHINGYTNGTFRPQATITRQEAAAIIASIHGIKEDKYKDINGKEIHTDTITKFDDDKSIATWADKSVEELSRQGIIVGYKEGNKEYFKPANKIQRAEALVMMQRGMEKLK